MTERIVDGTALEAVGSAWAEALGVDTVDPDVGFFDLGASSATVVGVVRVLRARWPRLQVIDLFAHPTVTSLAALLEAREPTLPEAGDAAHC